MAGAEKILVVRVGLGGDLVMITPALNQLLAGFPAAEVHLLTTAEGRRVMQGYHERLTRIWLYHRRFPARLWLQRTLTRELRAQGYTRIFIMEDKPFYRNWLGDAAPLVHTLGRGAEGQHFCTRLADLVDGALPEPPPRGWVTLGYSAAGESAARQLLAAHGIAPEALLVGLHPVFSGSSRWPWSDRKGQRHRVWPPAFFARLARLLQREAAARQRPLSIVIDTLPDDRAVVESIVEQSAGAIVMLSAPPDFDRYKALLARLDVLVSPNTGPMHFAAALGTPVVGLFSGWSALDCGPFVPSDRALLLSAEDQAEPARGLAAIRPETVSASVWRILDGPVPSRRRSFSAPGESG
ncbi:glycosyltransferase family 9 protein [bacterium]|nr:glycosyltransferase family 9 protein [bacterium]